MYEQLDGILTCRDLSRVSSVKLRQPWVPLHRAPKRPRYLNFGLRPHEACRHDSEAISDSSGRLWRLKNTATYNVFAIFHVAPQTSSRSSKSAPGRSQNDPQEAPRSGPGRPRRDPRGFTTAPRAARSATQARPRAA